VLLLLPLNVDHLTLPSTKPDPRRPAHFESVLQPSKTGVCIVIFLAFLLHYSISLSFVVCCAYSVQSRWSHERASIDANAEWRTTELNP
jgi:hypothetical protein